MLTVTHLHKRFGRKTALDDISFHIEKGQIYGLLGHNGAGKSTTLGIILAMISADSGEVSIGGTSVLKNRSEALRKVGAIFESPAFFEYMSGWENLQQLIAYSGTISKKRVAEVVEDVGLTDRIHSKVGSYSHGMRQRLALAQSLLPEPEILLLDEPTDGLDPEGIKWFRDFILRLRSERGITVLFNSHLLSEVEQMCDSVAIIKQGRLLHDGPLADITEARTPRFTLRTPPAQTAATDAVLAQLGATRIDASVIEMPESTSAAELNRQLVHAGIAVSEIAPRRRTLEDFYLSIGKSQPA